MACVGGSVAVSGTLAAAPLMTTQAIRYAVAIALFLAVARLTEVFQLPSGGLSVSRAMLRADPSWAPLRGHPGFERLIAEHD